MQHDWVSSNLGHGNFMCSRCFVTDLEAAAIGMVECGPLPPKSANENWSQAEIDADSEPPFICPVTCQPCLTEQDEFCEDYGCARKAGFNVDRV